MMSSWAVEASRSTADWASSGSAIMASLVWAVITCARSRPKTPSGREAGIVHEACFARRP
jgi:hypothetical protein